jgi:threonine synthase
MGYELFEQLGRLPDAIVYPTGGGTGLIGMWKAFDEMERLGWIGPTRPKMFTVQAAGCAPIVRAWEAGTEAAAPWEGARTYASGLRVPARDRRLPDPPCAAGLRAAGRWPSRTGDGRVGAADRRADTGVFCRARGRRDRRRPPHAPARGA